MVKRLLSPIANRSFFLFGARGTGKTTWIERQFRTENDLYIDLLDPDVEDRYGRKPQLLDQELEKHAHAGRLPRFVILDEVQKAPRLLDVAQKWIFRKKLKFLLTGSSSRKLKRGHANLLGGRANTYALFPLTSLELKGAFDLNHALEWGTLPEAVEMKGGDEKTAFLKSYCQTYLKEEILTEQLIRKLPPFRDFIEILAQNNGKLLNIEKFANDVGVDNKTISAYLDILEETHLGNVLRPFAPSLRKSQLLQPKFYYFDQGVKRKLDGTLGTPLLESTSAFGEAFESWLINEIIRLLSYRDRDERVSFYKSKNGPEIDLILSKGRRRTFIEIKSTAKIDEKEVRAFENLTRDFDPDKRLIYLSRDSHEARIGNVECLNYLGFLKAEFGTRQGE